MILNSISTTEIYINIFYEIHQYLSISYFHFEFVFNLTVVN